MERMVLALLLLTAVSAFSRPAEIILIRHAEETSDPKNVHLSKRGMERAATLPMLFTNATEFTTNGTPSALFAARPKPGKSRRSLETLRPTGKALHKPVRAPFVAEQAARLARALNRNPAYKGKTVLIAWNHEFLPALAKAFGVQDPPAWDNNTFDRVWVITYNGDNAVFQDLPQNLLDGDSNH